MELRPYQEECLEALDAHYAAGNTRALVALPTGSGKTIIFSHAIERYPGPAMILAHRDELINQTAEKYQAVASAINGGPPPVGIVKAARKEWNAPVVVASVQTLSRKKTLSECPRRFGFVIVDEAHHAPADSYLRVLEAMGCLCDDQDAAGPITLGVTATPRREDSKSIQDVWPWPPAYSLSIVDLIRQGYLCDIIGKRIETDIDYSGLRVQHGDIHQRMAQDRYIRYHGPETVAKAYRDHAGARQGLIFLPGVEAAKLQMEALRRLGISAEFVEGRTPLEVRRGILRDFAAGKVQVIANCGVLTEGFDSPGIECVTIARPTRSKTLYAQMIGRGTRIHPGKENCLILDIAGASQRHDIVDLAEEFKLSRLEEDEPLTEAIEREEREKKEAEVIEIENAKFRQFDLYGEEKAVSVTMRRSPVRTVTLSKSKKLLAFSATDDRQFLMAVYSKNYGYYVARFEDGGMGVSVWQLSKGQNRRWQAVKRGSFPGPDVAVRWLVDQSRQDGSQYLVFPGIACHWRDKPASERQLEFMWQKRRLAANEETTRGEACDALAIWELERMEW